MTEHIVTVVQGNRERYIRDWSDGGVTMYRDALDAAAPEGGQVRVRWEVEALPAPVTEDEIMDLVGWVSGHVHREGDDLTRATVFDRIVYELREHREKAEGT